MKGMKEYRELTERLFKVPESVQQLIPVHKIAEDGIFLLENKPEGAEKLFDKEKDEAYAEEQIHFYIDAEGEDALEKSYAYQTENYMGIFKESNVFSHLVQTAEGYYTVPFEYGGYVYRYVNGQAEVLPAYDPHGMTRIHAGGAVLTKIPVCGYYEDEMFTEITQEQAEELFISLNRMTPDMRNLL